MAKRVRVSGYARVRRVGPTVVVTQVRPYRRRPPKQEKARFQMRYRKRPVEVEAMRVPFSTDDRELEYWGRLSAWLGPGGPWEIVDGGQVAIKTLEGTMVANPGDWIIRGIQNELYPCKPDIFDQTYEPADER
jgi:hypothetical protein